MVVRTVEVERLGNSIMLQVSIYAVEVLLAGFGTVGIRIGAEDSFPASLDPVTRRYEFWTVGRRRRRVVQRPG